MKLKRVICSAGPATQLKSVSQFIAQLPPKVGSIPLPRQPCNENFGYPISRSADQPCLFAAPCATQRHRVATIGNHYLLLCTDVGSRGNNALLIGNCAIHSSQSNNGEQHFNCLVHGGVSCAQKPRDAEYMPEWAPRNTVDNFIFRRPSDVTRDVTEQVGNLQDRAPGPPALNRGIIFVSGS